MRAIADAVSSALSQQQLQQQQHQQQPPAAGQHSLRRRVQPVGRLSVGTAASVASGVSPVSRRAVVSAPAGTLRGTRRRMVTVVDGDDDVSGVVDDVNGGKASVFDRLGPCEDSTLGHVTTSITGVSKRAKPTHASSVRCRDWPQCFRGADCRFHHPTELCQYFPSCPFGDDCRFVHPSVPCRFGVLCTRQGCAFRVRDSLTLALDPSHLIVVSHVCISILPKQMCRVGTVTSVRIANARFGILGRCWCVVPRGILVGASHDCLVSGTIAIGGALPLR